MYGGSGFVLDDETNLEFNARNGSDKKTFQL
jgi:hypothetical protein